MLSTPAHRLAKIGHADVGMHIDQDVGGFEVAMNHTGFVGVGDGLANLNQNIKEARKLSLFS